MTFDGRPAMMGTTSPTLRRAAAERARQLLASDGIPDGIPNGSPFATPRQRWAHSLALVQAYAEMATELQSLADAAVGDALAGGASYAAVGAARGISRQAVRKWHQKRQMEQQARREAFRARRQDLDDDYYVDGDDEDHWPPRSWRFRAPAGTWTVRLIGGPLDSQTVRVPVGDDAYPLVDHTTVLGSPLSPRYARYSPAKPGDNEYVFTGEFYIRCR